MAGDTPILIVLTPVRNEAWILDKFLQAVSLWADYIIISDQMSSDGSREIAKRFPKVRLLENNSREMHMAATRRLLLEEANRILGDKILFALDADEFLAGNFMDTDDWKTILSSEVGDIFCWRWMNLLPGCSKYTSWQPYYWASHVGDEADGFFPDNYIHEQRLPMPETVHHEYVLDELFSLHFARVNIARQRNKEIYYQVTTLTKQPDDSGIRLFRMYHTSENAMIRHKVDDRAFSYYRDNNIDLRELAYSNDCGQYYLDEIARLVKENGSVRYRKLDIWTEDLCSSLGVENPQRITDRVIMWYLRHTKNSAGTFMARAMDKLLKTVY